jgi:tRNA(adenine34) deaminase
MHHDKMRFFHMINHLPERYNILFCCNSLSQKAILLKQEIIIQVISFHGSYGLTETMGGGRNLPDMIVDYKQLMGEALIEAEKGLEKGEVPVGAVIAGPEGEILARGYNQPISFNDPTAHAEIIVLRDAALSFKNYRLPGTTLVVTIEPCLMCMGAALNARVSRLVFGAFDPKTGAAGSIYNLAEDARLNHRIEVISGIMENECREILQEFFRTKRVENKF